MVSYDTVMEGDEKMISVESLTLNVDNAIDRGH